MDNSPSSPLSCLKIATHTAGIRTSSLRPVEHTLRKIPLGPPTYHKDIGRDQQELNPDQRNIAKRVLGEYADERRVQKPNAGEVEVARRFADPSCCYSFAKQPANRSWEAAGSVA
ncbi:hypothetical protein TcasGA2_TC008310 [Tribolium castaneum]|uniref:Uncharacterized protein n=1 Tax=Tribolium castaneum TaxID=7070 RepID=D2A117_TRICA|nr:hypothetical protein TcasGA2_TC008310 [Tribolium castaneum]